MKAKVLRIEPRLFQGVANEGIYLPVVIFDVGAEVKVYLRPGYSKDRYGVYVPIVHSVCFEEKPIDVPYTLLGSVNLRYELGQKRGTLAIRHLHSAGSYSAPDWALAGSATIISRNSYEVCKRDETVKWISNVLMTDFECTHGRQYE